MCTFIIISHFTTFPTFAWLHSVSNASSIFFLKEISLWVQKNSVNFVSVEWKFEYIKMYIEIRFVQTYMKKICDVKYVLRCSKIWTRQQREISSNRQIGMGYFKKLVRLYLLFFKTGGIVVVYFTYTPWLTATMWQMAQHFSCVTCLKHFCLPISPYAWFDIWITCNLLCFYVVAREPCADGKSL